MNNHTLLDPRNALYLTIRKIEGAYAHATIRAYRVDFLDFIHFCENLDMPALPASGEAVSAFIESLMQQGKRSASIRRAVAGIASIHQMNGLVDPTKTIECKLALRRMHRQIGRFCKQALGINERMLETLINAASNNLNGKRDRALLLMAYDSLCRRGELVSFRAEDIRYNMIDAVTGSICSAILLRKSKTDQEAFGQWVKLSARTMQAIDDWLSAAGIREGLLFRGVNRNGQLTEKLDPCNIARIYRRLAKRAHLNKEVIRGISGHSTRVGAAQDLLLSGVSLPILMSRGRWTKAETVMRYVEHAGICV